MVRGIHGKARDPVLAGRVSTVMYQPHLSMVTVDSILSAKSISVSK